LDRAGGHPGETSPDHGAERDVGGIVKKELVVGKGNGGNGRARLLYLDPALTDHRVIRPVKGVAEEGGGARSRTSSLRLQAKEVVPFDHVEGIRLTRLCRKKLNNIGVGSIIKTG
jgi:hypothetical protein